MSEPKSPNSSAEDQRRETARHEAGHAVTGYLHGFYPAFVDIVPDDFGNVGHTSYENHPTRKFRYLDESEEKRKYVELKTMIKLAGTAAQDLLSPGRARDSGDARDAEDVREFVSDRVSWEGHDAYIARQKEKVSELLKKNQPLVEAVAKALLDRSSLSGEEMVALLDAIPNRQTR